MRPAAGRCTLPISRGSTGGSPTGSRVPALRDRRADSIAGCGAAGTAVQLPWRCRARARDHRTTCVPGRCGWFAHSPSVRRPVLTATRPIPTQPVRSRCVVRGRVADRVHPAGLHEIAHPSRGGAAKPRDSLSQPGCRTEPSHVLGWNALDRRASTRTATDAAPPPGARLDGDRRHDRRDRRPRDPIHGDERGA